MAKELGSQRVDTSNSELPQPFPPLLGGEPNAKHLPSVQEPFQYSNDHLITLMAQTVNISEDVAKGKLQYLLRNNPDIVPKKQKVKGQPGNKKVLFFTQEQSDTLLHKASQVKTRKIVHEPARNIDSPPQQIPKAEPERTKPTPKEIFERSSLYVLSRIAEENIEQVNTDIRIILGDALPPRSNNSRSLLAND